MVTPVGPAYDAARMAQRAADADAVGAWPGLRELAAGVPALALLLACELLWALALDVPLDGPRILAAACTLGSALAAALLVTAALGRLGCRLWRRRGATLFRLAACAPLAWLAASSLTSGGWISGHPRVALLRAGILLALMVIPVVLLFAAARVEGSRDGWPRTVLAGALAAGLAGASLADGLLQVGHYPAFHLASAGMGLGCALLLGRLAAARWPAWALGLCAAIAVATLTLIPFHVVGRPADAFVATTRGFTAKARWLAVALLDALPSSREASVRPEPVLRSAPELLRSPLDLAAPGWTVTGSLATGSARLSVDGAGVLSQSLPGLALPGGRYRARVRLELEPGTTLDGTLTLVDGRDGARHAAPLAGEGPARSAVLQVELGPTPADATAERVLLDLAPAAMRPESGLAWIAPMPPEVAWLAENRRTPDTPPATLREDGVDLGPIQRSHDGIRLRGGGAWCLWGDWLYFSTPDGSDPRGNGRRYEIVGPRGPEATSLGFELGLSGRGAARVVELSLIEPLPDGLSVEQDLGREFRLVPSAGPRADALRAAVTHVVVILMDALRDDYVGPRASGPSLTPHLDALAAGGARFTAAYSPSDQTGRSVPCLMTSLPLEVTLRAADWGAPVSTWLELLDVRGWASFFNGSDYVAAKYGHLPLPDRLGATHAGSRDEKSPLLSAEVAAFARARGDAPFAVYSHWSYPHVGRTRDVVADYEAAVALSDRFLGELVDALRATGQWERTLLVVTADHGYGLGEDHRYLGAHGCAEMSLRVPLVIHLPGLTRGGLTIAQPVSNLALGPTILDLFAPDCAALVGEPSLLPLLLAAEAGAPEPAPRPVFASTGFSAMTRWGSRKLTEDQSLRAVALFDVLADPAERAPLADAASEDELRALRQAELARQTRLAQAVVARGRSDLAPDVVRAFARDGLSAPVLAPVLARYWEHDGPTREFLLAEVYRRRVAGLAPALDALAREGGGRDEDLRLVVAAWAGSADAAAELAARLPRLHDDALAWLAAVLPDLPRGLALALAPQLAAMALDLSPARPSADTHEGRVLALLLMGLPFHLESKDLGAVKDMSVDLFNSWSTEPVGDGPSFASLRERKHVRRSLLDVLVSDPAPEDLARAERLVQNRHAADRVPELVRRLDTPEARTWLLEYLRQWNGVDEDPPGKHVGFMLPTLAAIDDPSFRADANRILEQRFPYLSRLE